MAKRLTQLVLVAFISIIVLACSSIPGLAQTTTGATGPDQRAIAAKQAGLDQEERNIGVQQVSLNEFQLKAQKIKRQLEALSFMSDGQIPQRLQDFAGEMTNELARLNRQIESSKSMIESQTLLLEVGKRQLNAMQEQYKAKASSGASQLPKSPPDEYRDRINQQNERIHQDMLARQKQVDLQNQRLMQEVAPPHALDPSRSGLSMPAVDDSYDVNELKLCEMLEKKASGKDYDIAEINLLATQGLPGAEKLDVAKTLKTLDLWAAWVKHETDRHLYKFQKAPEEYSNSEAYFRILMMVCTLQEDFNICYNKDPKMRAGPVELIPNDFTFFGNPRDLFIHGLTEGEHEGTCASLPVLYVAIGRRLGYPLKLVECKGHLFVRWEDTKERFNIEGTSRGLNCYPDQEYMEWPWPISKEELETGMYMKSLSPKREVAVFLELRSLCLKQHKHEKEHMTVKLFADDLRKRDGVDLDKLNLLMRQYAKSDSSDGSVGSALLYQTLTNTNSWRAPGNERGARGKHTVFSIDRFDSK